MELFSQETVILHIREIITLVVLCNLFLVFLVLFFQDNLKLSSENIRENMEDLDASVRDKLSYSSQRLDASYLRATQLEEALNNLETRLDNEVLASSSRLTSLENPVAKKAGKKVNPRVKKTYKRGPYLKKTTKKITKKTTKKA